MKCIFLKCHTQSLKQTARVKNLAMSRLLLSTPSGERGTRYCCLEMLESKTGLKREIIGLAFVRSPETQLQMNYDVTL